MEGIQRDIQHAIRNLLRHPGFLAAAVITLALGIGGTTPIFSTVNALLVRPPDFPNLDRCSPVSCWRAAQRKSIRWWH